MCARSFCKVLPKGNPHTSGHSVQGPDVPTLEAEECADLLLSRGSNKPPLLGEGLRITSLRGALWGRRASPDWCGHETPDLGDLDVPLLGVQLAHAGRARQEAVSRT